MHTARHTPLHVIHAVGVLFLLASLTGCGSSSEPAPAAFTYQTSLAAGTSIQVQLSDGTPVVGAIVQIQDHLREPTGEETREELETGKLYFHGQTNAAGVVRGLCKFPVDVTTCDVLVTSPAHTGPYTFESHREFWGATAPSARVQFPVTSQLNATLVVEARQ